MVPLINKVARPSKSEIEKYLTLWDSLENYRLQESSLKKLFTKTYPLNDDLNEVLIKVCALNDFYSTSIYYPVQVAKHIVSLQLDKKLMIKDPKVVNEIASVQVKKDKLINYYSFATKYCSHHHPTLYPIYDSYVDKLLMHFKKEDNFFEFKKSDLKIYENFKNILEKFRIFYDLEDYDLKQIDKYLWQAGKEYFPRAY
jgi:hypothetical protein